MHLLLLDKLYSLRLWSEQTRLFRLESSSAPKIMQTNVLLPWVSGFFSRVRRGASFRRPQADKCRAGHLTEIGNRAWEASATQGNVLLKCSSSRLTLRICGTQRYRCRLPSKVSKVQILNFSKARFRRRTFQEPYLIGIKADRKYLDRLNWFRRRS